MKHYIETHLSEITQEKAYQLFLGINKSLLATLINASLLSFVMWNVSEKLSVISWFSIIVVISIFRLSSAIFYKKQYTDHKKGDSRKWLLIFRTGAILSGFSWGLASIVLFPENDVTYQVFMAFVMGGMAAGATTTLSYDRPSILLFLTLSLVPLIIHFFLHQHELSTEMGIMLVLFTLILSQSALQNYRSNIKSIISKIKNIEQEIEINESEHRYQNIINTASDAFYLHDIDGYIKDTNQQACDSLGYSRNEILSSRVDDIDKSFVYNNDIIKFWHNLPIGDRTVFEGIHTRKDGSEFHVEVSLGKVIVDDKPFITVLARDITERKENEKLKNEFISTVSHELRTPLTSIKGALGLVNGGTFGKQPEEVNSMLQLAETNASRLLLLINDLLDIQKYEAGKFSLVFEEIDLVQLLKNIINENQEYAKQHNVRYIITKMPEQLILMIDKYRINQAITNLLSNAAKFSHPGNDVEIALIDKSNQVTISIKDFGRGIPEEFHETIFDKFTQSDSSDSRVKGGTGLGLNITKKIVEVHNGELSFTTEEGKGTTFFITLNKD